MKIWVLLSIVFIAIVLASSSIIGTSYGKKKLSGIHLFIVRDEGPNSQTGWDPIGNTNRFTVRNNVLTDQSLVVVSFDKNTGNSAAEGCTVNNNIVPPETSESNKRFEFVCAGAPIDGSELHYSIINP